MANKTTIVIPNLNGEKYLMDCLTFLNRQTCEFDTIVVDNGSTDGSLEMLKERFRWAKVISFSENKGFCKAVNAGIVASETPYIILLNNDTVVENDFVEQLEHAIENKPNYFSIGAKMLSMKKQDEIDDAGDLYCALGWAFALGKGKSSELYAKDREVFAACAGAAIYRRTVFEHIGLFDENHFAYLEDIDIGYRAKLYGYRNGYCSSAIVYHAGSAFSGSRYNEFKIQLAAQNSIYLIWKNMPLFQILINLPFFLLGYFIKIIFFVIKGFGMIYLRGLQKGFLLCNKKSSKKYKIYFTANRLGYYLKIQIALWLNTIRRITG